MGGFKKFKEEFCNKEYFYSLLADRKISHKEHEHVLNLWNKFEMTMCWKNFEIIARKNYGLCPSHYVGAPGSS